MTRSVADPRRLSSSNVSPAVWGVLEAASPAERPAGVILLAGSSGWRTEYTQIAESMASAGFDALALDYLAETGREPSDEEQTTHWLTWEGSVRNGLELLQGRLSQGRRAIGLVGYSLGGYLAISVASSLPDVKAVVEFFGGGGRGPRSLEEQVRSLPPLLILHGEADSVVPVRQGYQLRDAALAQGRHVEMHVYPGAEHGFNAPWSPNFSEAESSDSLARTIGFLHRWLKA